MDLTDNQLERYARHIVLREVGGMGQKKLLAARVLVIGAGGLGSPLLLYLAAAGVGTLGIIDDDQVSLSNLQRQVLYGTDAVGHDKTKAAADRINAINPDVRVICHDARLTAANAQGIIADYDLVADGCDNFATRFIVNEACFALGKTLVSGAISQFDGQVATFRPGDDTPCYQCFVPELPNEPGGTSCAEAGVLGAVAGVVGSLQATEVLKEILDLGDSLAGSLLLYDALGTTTRRIRLPKDPACPLCGADA